MFDEDQKKLLAEPLDPANVKTRRGADQRNVSYVEGWQIIDEANRIFGFDGWSSETVEMRALHEPKLNVEDNNVVSAYFSRVRVTVYAGDRTIVREGCGASRGFAKTAGEAAENAAKGAETDALKRAFRTFGNAFGLALYDKQQRNVGKPRRPRQVDHQQPLDVGFDAPRSTSGRAIAAREGAIGPRPPVAEEVPF